MDELIFNYVANVNRTFSTGNATEHSYRGFLQTFLQNISDCGITNEPQGQECGKPDYIVQKNGLTVGYIEAKNIGVNLDEVENSKQLLRYLSALDNLILTDYLEFRFFRNGKKICVAKIARVENGKIKKSNDGEIETILQYFADFFSFRMQIASANQLAETMAKKAQLLKERTLASLNENQNGALYDQFCCLQKMLINDLTEDDFSDIYAQTVVYGLFAARLNETDGGNFSRLSAAGLIPQTDPFLRQFFHELAGFDLDKNIAWIVDELVEVFKNVDFDAIFNGEQDPFIHFYETFLSKYDFEIRKNRGVYYTPKSVVRFIVRSVDKILQRDFNLPNGLAADVKILDPATGTGTFLYETLCEIWKKFENQKGAWQNYVDAHLLSRIFGFEIMMAPYAMCHLKLGDFLAKTSWQNRENKRLEVYLTNSLEGKKQSAEALFSQWLAQESEGADRIKNANDVMVVVGNPPYNRSSFNNSGFITNLMHSYTENLDEKNLQPLSNDCLKFIRLAQNFVERRDEGIVAFITENTFADGLIFRKMRESLLTTFDAIYILNLHGNSLKKEAAPDGSPDENVFDIRQGVSINIFVKLPQRTHRHSEADLSAEESRDEMFRFAQHDEKGVFYFDIFGKRQAKFDFLDSHDIETVAWQKLSQASPHFFFAPKDLSLQNEWNAFFGIDELMKVFDCGVVTSNDKELIAFNSFDTENNQQYNYRPFDIRYINYDGEKIERPRKNIMRQMMCTNVALLTCKQQRVFDFRHIFLTDCITDYCSVSSQTGEGCRVFPLYLYDKNALTGEVEKRANLNEEIVRHFEALKTPKNLMFRDSSVAALPQNDVKKEMFRFAQHDEKGTHQHDGVEAPQHDENRKAQHDGELAEQIFFYIYAVLHSPSYRKKYKEHLKIGFPRIPYPQSAKNFAELAQKGKELANLHLMKSAKLDQLLTGFNVSGSNKVESVKWQDGKVFINQAQFFDNVPENAWNFWIGGYQPLQKYLKDRKSRSLSFDEIHHWQKIVVALVETEKIMAKIDETLQL